MGQLRSYTESSVIMLDLLEDLSKRATDEDIDGTAYVTMVLNEAIAQMCLYGVPFHVCQELVARLWGEQKVVNSPPYGEEIGAWRVATKAD